MSESPENPQSPQPPPSRRSPEEEPAGAAHPDPGEGGAAGGPGEGDAAAEGDAAGAAAGSPGPGEEHDAGTGHAASGEVSDAADAAAPLLDESDAEADAQVLRDVPPGDRIAAAVLAAARRVTLPFQAARADRSFATAFWYNDLVDATPGREVIRQYLVTAEARTRYELGQWTLRDGIVEPELPADELVMPSFAKKWTRLGDLGAAAMPTVDLHLHAEKRGWRWATHEITAGLAAQPADIALIGAEPLPAYVLGHEVDQEAGAKHPLRPQRLLPGAVTRTSDDPAAPVRFTAPLPDGFSGAPVFAALPMDDDQLKLVCLGLVLPAPAGPDAPTADAAPVASVVVTFDLLRPAIHAVTPSRTRHWWQRG